MFGLIDRHSLTFCENIKFEVTDNDILRRDEVQNFHRAAENRECTVDSGNQKTSSVDGQGFGLKPILSLAAVVPPDPEDFKANLLLDGIFGAEIHVVDLEEGESFADAEKRSFKMGKEHIARLAEEGVKSYDIPMGGANKYGSLGYVNAMVEIARQMESEGLHFDHM